MDPYISKFEGKLHEIIQNSHENHKTQAQKFTVEKLTKLERQKQVYTLDLQGYQNKEIAEKLNCSLSTVEKDLQDIKKNASEWFREASKSGLAKSLVDAVLQIDFVQKELWKLYQEETQKQIKIKLLESIVSSSLRKKELFWTSGQKPSWHNLGT